VHVEEAVRSVTELEHVLNLLGERLVSWASRDAPPTGDEEGAAALARRLGSPDAPATEALVPAPDPVLTHARAQLAALYERTAETRRSLETALETAMPERAPNLCSLLGPILAARMVSQAGGLDRLARLPASTIQVLGAERSFFEHLRGRAPPPRHGWLFLHPEIQGAPKRLRGKLARGLAGKVAIAARLDQQGTALRPELTEQFRRRAKEIRGVPGAKGAVKPFRKGPLRPAT
jgi:nucleolar protein 56